MRDNKEKRRNSMKTREAERRRDILLPAALVLCTLLFLLASGVYFTQYLQSQIFAERTAQLSEITSQVQANLRNVLNFH